MSPRPCMDCRSLQLGSSRSAAPIRTRACGSRRRYFRRSGIAATRRYGCSTVRVRSGIQKTRPIIRRSFGFPHSEALVALVGPSPDVPGDALPGGHCPAETL